MKKLILLLLCTLALGITTARAQELTKKEKRAQAKEVKAAEKAQSKTEKQNKQDAKKAAKREARFAKFIEMVRTYEPVQMNTKNVVALKNLVGHMNDMMADIILLEKAFNSVEMVSEAYVDEDGIPGTSWSARNRYTQQTYSNNEAEELLRAQKRNIVAKKTEAGLLVIEATNAGAGIATANLSTADKIALGLSATQPIKQAKFIRFGLGAMNYHLNKNMEYLGFQLDNEGADSMEDE